MDKIHSEISDQILTVVDVETTGLYPPFDRICEIAVLQIRGDETLQAFTALVNPERPISPEAMAVNGITDADLADAPRFVSIADKVQGLLDGAVLVCHNAPFDLSFIENEFSRLQRTMQVAGVVDTLDIARRYFHFRSNSLSNLAASLGIRNPQAHRALGDAVTTHQVLRKLLAMSGLAQVPDWSLVSSFKPQKCLSGEISLPDDIRVAIEENKAIEILYLDGKGQQTCRLITPRQAVVVNEMVYLVAYCHLRQEERHFRLDRILQIVHD